MIDTWTQHAPAWERYSMDADAMVIDPSIPLSFESWQSKTPSGASQRGRRAQLLAAARWQLSERGYDGLSMQDLAHDLEVSKQTIYNLVGNKRALAATAIIDHLTWMAETVRRCSGSKNMILRMVELYCLNFRQHMNYTRHAALAMFQRDRSLCMEIRRKQRTWFLVWLRNLAAEGKLRETVDLDVLAKQLVVLNEGNMLDWAQGYCKENELLQSLITSHGLMLLAASTSDEASMIEGWMDARRKAS